MEKLRKYWEQLVEPKFSSQDHEAFHNARILDTLILVLLPAGLLVITISSLLDPGHNPLQQWDFVAQFPAALGLYFAYYLSRKGEYRLASRLTILVVSLFIFLVGWGNNDVHVFSFVIVQVMLSGMLLSEKETTVIALVDMVFLAFLGLLNPQISFAEVLSGPAVFLIIGIILIYAGKKHQRVLERYRREELKESETRYRNLFEATFEGMVVHNQGIILDANSGFANMFGYKIKDVIGKPLVQFAAPESQHLLRGQPKMGSAIEILGLRKNGTKLNVEIISNEHFHNGRRVYVAAVRDITERKRSEEQLRHDALYDALTNLPNRTLFMDRLELAILRQKRRNYHKFAVLFLDLDRFKIINDSLGHDIGDRLLVEVAKRLKNCSRAVDTVARIGGDEFVVLIEDIRDSFDAIHTAERILQNIQIPCVLQDHEVTTTASLGIVISDSRYTRPEQYLRDADTAMYHAKELGKARYEVFDTIMRQKIMNRLEMEMDLRSAVERKEFEIHYQPILSLVSGNIIGFEALVRWRHPRLGLIYPIEFISLAEETGLIIEIGEWVLENACAQIYQWQREYFRVPPMSVSVNLSGKQLMQPDLVDRIKKILAKVGLDPTSLSLEVTESVIISDIDAAKRALREIKSLGIQVHMDDFGTGYSSLGHLHQFPIDQIKIDRTFTSSMLSNKNNMGLVRSIVLMGHELGLNVVAEGIETTEQMSRLGELGCEYGQGYYLSKPLRVSEVNGFLTRGDHK